MTRRFRTILTDFRDDLLALAIGLTIGGVAVLASSCLGGCIALAPHVTIPPYMGRDYQVGFIDAGEPAPARGVFLSDSAWEKLKQRFQALDEENRRLTGRIEEP